MKDGPTDEVLSGACKWKCRVSSWLGSNLLASDIPIISGHLTADVTQDVTEKLTITVPRWARIETGGDRIDLRPSGSSDALARYGQQLDVTIIVTSVATGTIWETRVGRFQILDWSDDDQGTLKVTAEGMLARVRDDKLTAPTSPTGTFEAEVKRLIPAGLGVEFDSALTDRSCPTSMSWATDRLGALKDIANAWPALLRTDEWGQIQYKAPLDSVPSPVFTWTDGDRGTVVLAPRKDSRKDAYNRVIASSSNADTADVVGTASVTSGDMSVNGDYGVVSKKWSSPLIATTAQAEAAAQTMLDNSRRPATSIPVQIAPDPRVDLDDAVEVIRGGVTEWGWVTGYDLPLTVTDGAMKVKVGVSL